MKNFSIAQRPRRNRRTESIRQLVRETHISPANLVMPYFVIPGKSKKETVKSMPGITKLSIDLLCKDIKELHSMGVSGVALFPSISDGLKDSKASESKNQQGLLPQAIRAIKDAVPDIAVITDVAMDPYSSDGHDGFVKDGKILNDETLPILAEMAIVQAKAGADLVAPSDMMDGRVGYIRQELDEAGFSDVGILSYAAKYASAFYGPFRDALGSAPRFGDKKTYQMDSANINEAIREALLDEKEGADIVMVKPALAYLDVITKIKAKVHIPVAAYHVSGEYAMVKAASANSWVDETKVVKEMLVSIKRAGADIIFTYFAKQIASKLA